MGYSLGISAYFHESSISLFLDGDLIGFCREEYFSRVKGDNSFPRLAIQFYKQKYNLDSRNIDFVCFYEKPLRRFLTIITEAFKYMLESKELIYNNISNIRNSGLFFSYDLTKSLAISRNKIIYCPHHLSHVLSVLPFMEHELPHSGIVIDGVGDSACTSVYEINEKVIKLHKNTNYPKSLGLMYSAVTDYLGFNINDGEYKIMALAAYGNNACEQKFRDLVDDGRGNLKIGAFEFYRSLRFSYSQEFIKMFGPSYEKLPAYPAIGSNEFCRAADIAFAAQKYLEDAVTDIFKEANERTGHRNFTFSGGVALNSKLINTLIEKDYIDFLFVPPNPGDSGAAIGAGVLASLKSEKTIQFNKTPFLGPEPDELDRTNVKDVFLEKFGSQNDLWGVVAKLLSEGEIIGLVDGAVEVGPRALGHRSLLCDPRNKKVVKKLSQEVKRREEFRPLAPACLDFYVDDWFLVPEKVRATLQWMGSVVYPTDRCLRELEAVCHVDNTVRLQIVNRQNSSFYRLLTKFYELTKCPILINTSFNSGGDPIILDIQDTITTSIRMGIQYIVLGETLYKTNKQ